VGEDAAHPAPRFAVLLPVERTFPLQLERNGIYFVSQLLITTDGLFLIAAIPNDNSIWIWDLSTGAQKCVIKDILKYPRSPFRLALTADNQHIVCFSIDGGACIVRIWDLSTGKEEKTLKQDDDALPEMAFMDDKEYFINPDSWNISIWNMKNNKITWLKKDNADKITATAIIPKSKYFITVSEDHMIKVWDLEQKNCISTFQLDSPVCACDITPDGQTIIVGDNLGRIHFLRLETSDNRK